MDISLLIENHLNAHVCSVYHPEDAAADVCALRKAFGLQVPQAYMTVSPKPDSYNYTQARALFGVDKHQWNALCETVNKVGQSQKDVCNLKLDAQGVRRALLAPFNGDTAAWLSRQADCPYWFAQLILPIHPSTSVSLNTVNKVGKALACHRNILAQHRDFLWKRWNVHRGELLHHSVSKLNQDCIALSATPYEMTNMVANSIGATILGVVAWLVHANYRKQSAQ